MQLTEHFTLDELTASDTAIRLGIDNTPSDAVIENLKRTAAMGESIREILGQVAGHEVIITVTSGYRCEALERILCQSDYSAWCARRTINQNSASWVEYFSHKAHPKGRAIDFRAYRFGSPFQIVRELQKHSELIAEVDQIIMEGVTDHHDGWVHASWSEIPRHEIMTAVFDNFGTPHYSRGLT